MDFEQTTEMLKFIVLSNIILFGHLTPIQTKQEVCI